MSAGRWADVPGQGALAAVGDVVEATQLSFLEAAGRAALAAVLGAAIGLEREFAGREAGVRTHALLALGAALFALVSTGGFAAFAASSADTNVLVDVTRVASYVAAAVGFIGGGVIVKDRRGIRGLTTAATLWVTCAVGLACGVGLLAVATVVAACAIATLLLERPMRWVHRLLGMPDCSVRISVPDGASSARVRRLQTDLRGIRARGMRMESGADGASTTLTAMIDSAQLLQLVEDASTLGATVEFDVDLDLLGHRDRPSPQA